MKRWDDAILDVGLVEDCEWCLQVVTGAWALRGRSPLPQSVTSGVPASPEPDTAWGQQQYIAAEESQHNCRRLLSNKHR